MQTRKILRLAAALPVALALVAAPAFAQGVQQQQGEVPPPPDLSDERLEEVAEAFLEVSELQRDLQQRLENTDSPEEAQKLQAEANDEILAALDDHGVPVEEYTDVMNATQNHTSFRERFMAAVDKVQEGDPNDG
ncbi:MAG: DUF4168 domain-containing protein [Thermoanaerobaculia bacterium]